MTLDDAITALADADGIPAGTMQWLLDHWDDAAPACRALLDAFAAGRDQSERTSQALFYIIPLLGERADTHSFPALCRLLGDPDRANLALGEDATQLIAPGTLISTFNGDLPLLDALLRNPAADDYLRADLPLVMAYLARTGRLSEAAVYETLARLPGQLEPKAEHPVWFGWVRAVAMLGFAGLAARAEAMFRDGWIDPDLMLAEEFWDELNQSRAEPAALAARSWDDIAPLTDAIGTLEHLFAGGDAQEQPAPPPPEPLRNPLRTIGRNDPCPCGSGKKHKKCCLAAA